MDFFTLLQTLDKGIAASSCKLHMATTDGDVDPLDEFLAGRFDEWQSRQTKRNFGRPVVIAFISLPGAGRWLFAGAYDVQAEEARGDVFMYDLKPRQAASELYGRLVVEFPKAFRQSYLVAENWASHIMVSELLPERMVIEDFKGYSKVKLTKERLDIVTSKGIPSWRAALSSVAGVYVITDVSSGKMYVGSATGTEGIWGRWCDYAATGHGGNKELKQVLEENGPEHAANSVFGVLEIASISTSEEQMLERESHWKDLLMTRTYGYNSN